MRATRSDMAGFKEVYKDTGAAAVELWHALVQFCMYLWLIPVHLLVWLWLPELGEAERAARDLQRKRWADDDF